MGCTGVALFVAHGFQQNVRVADYQLWMCFTFLAQTGNVWNFSDTKIHDIIVLIEHATNATDLLSTRKAMFILKSLYQLWGKICELRAKT